MKRYRMGATALLVAAMAAAGAMPAAAQATGTTQRSERDAFTWSGRVPAGRWINVSNISGRITVERGSGDRVEVSATKSWRRSDPESVRFEVVKFGPNEQDVRICALIGESSECREDGMHTRNVRNNDVSVAFVVRVPQGVNVGMSTVNGGLEISGVTAQVEASTVNGSIEATTTGGPINATTVNGSIRARMGRFTNSQDIEFTTVNGSVIAEFTGDIDADVELSTVNGRFQTDYPVTVRGRLDPRHLRAQLGRGGPRIKLTTVNGNVELRRRD